MKAIEKGEPPAVRPDDCTGTTASLWDLFEACWIKDPDKRPDASTISRWLEEKGEQLVAELEK
jgi:hypothetical protein